MIMTYDVWPIHSVMGYIYQSTQDHENLLALHSSLSRVADLVLPLWSCLLEGTIMSNVDGRNFECPSCSGFGGLIRSANGAWLFIFIAKLHADDVTHIELVALLEGLRLAW